MQSTLSPDPVWAQQAGAPCPLVQHQPNTAPMQGSSGPPAKHGRRSLAGGCPKRAHSRAGRAAAASRRDRASQRWSGSRTGPAEGAGGTQCTSGSALQRPAAAQSSMSCGRPCKPPMCLVHSFPRPKPGARAPLPTPVHPVTHPPAGTHTYTYVHLPTHAPLTWFTNLFSNFSRNSR